MPGLKKAELIDGVVYVPSPTRWNLHAVPHQAMSTWLGNFWADTPGTQAGDNGTLQLDLENVPQPDLALIVLPSHGGQVDIDDDHYIVGAPELVGEISSSSKSIDLNSKLRLYLRNRVQEYIVWRVEDEAIDWFIQRQGRFERIEPDAAGIIQSEVFPGLWLDPQALIKLDLARVLHVLRSKVSKPPPIRRLSPGWCRMQLAAANQVDGPTRLWQGADHGSGPDRPATGPVTGQEHSPLSFRRLVPYILRRGSHPRIQA